MSGMRQRDRYATDGDVHREDLSKELKDPVGRHKNARTTPHSRALIAERVSTGEPQAAVARSFGLCDRTVRKRTARAAEGELALV
jgi:hypothetical protein